MISSLLLHARRALAPISALLTLAGCVPYVTSYSHLEAEGVHERRPVCGDIGPPVFAIYEAHGLRFQVTLEPGTGVLGGNSYVRFFTADTSVVTIQGGGVMTPSGGEPVAFALKPGSPDPSPYSGPYLKERRRTEHRYVFVGVEPLPASGSHRLPEILVDGERVSLPVFTFERRIHAGITPINC